MYTRLALMQAWPTRLKEVDIINNYRLKTDGQGIPKYPKSTNVFGIPNLSFCVGSFCVGPAKAAKKALTHVNYEYS
jgi:pyruvate dehydrogenase complex dehydrogenase (E1) component